LKNTEESNLNLKRLQLSIKRPGEFYYTSYKELDAKCGSETLVPIQQTTGLVTKKNKIRFLPSYERHILAEGDN